MDGLRGVFSLLYQRNLVLQQVKVRWRALQMVGGFFSRRYRVVSLIAVAVFLLDLALGSAAVWLWSRYGAGQLLEDAVARYTLSSLQVTRGLLDWVMGTPAGLKLNTPLSLFLGSRCLYLLRLWEIFYHDFLSHYLPLLLPLLPPLTSSLGLSLSLSVLHDFFKFLNLCHICFFVFSYRLLSLQLSALLSLSRLFRGKKWNVLRQRVDSCDYNTNQLLLGTIVFTALLFLLPTTTVFACLFFSLRLLQWTVQLVLRVLVVGINWSTFSLFHLLERLEREDSVIKLRLREREGETELVWRGRRWRGEEMKKKVDETDTNVVLCDLLGEGNMNSPRLPLATVAGLWTTL